MLCIYDSHSFWVVEEKGEAMVEAVDGKKSKFLGALFSLRKCSTHTMDWRRLVVRGGMEYFPLQFSFGVGGAKNLLPLQNRPNRL